MTANKEPSITELAHMRIEIFPVKNFVIYPIQTSNGEHGGRFHDSIVLDDIRSSREFFIERSKYCNEERDKPPQHPLPPPYSFSWAMNEELTNDIELAKEIVPYYSNYYFRFSNKVKKDKEIIKLMLAHYEACHWTNPPNATHVLKRENRLAVAYEIIKEFPEYEECLGATLKKKIGSMSLVEYVERKNLQKSLKKDLKKKEKPVMRTKI